ncbi:MAG: hypothetical protein VW397_08180 [Candidatus Margulisiibacteriota bacterium]
MLPRTLYACLKNFKKTSPILPWTLNAYTQKLTINRHPIMLPLSSKDRNQFELKTSSAMIKPNLVQHHAVSNKHDYNHFKNLKEKQVYRSNLLKKISETLSESKRDQFVRLAEQVSEKGALTFTNLINDNAFKKLVKSFNNVMELKGSKSVLHSFVNLKKDPDFLTNSEFNDAFAHPLLILLISYIVGSPVRVVDARGKHTGKMSVQAQDNMLHIDNTPYNQEYKVILTWEKDSCKGPSGQNFVYIEGSHKLIRDSKNKIISAADLHKLIENKAIVETLIKKSFIIPLKSKDPNSSIAYELNGNKIVNDSNDIEPGVISKLKKYAHGWATENGSIFIESDSIQSICPNGSTSDKKVVEISSESPTTTVFAAGELVHHRYRTNEGDPRSCIILAFHPVTEDEQLFLPQQEGQLGSVYGKSSLNTTDKFFDHYLVKSSGAISTMLDGIAKSEKSGPKVLNPEHKKMSKEKFLNWIQTATSAPKMQEIKKSKLQGVMKRLVSKVSPEEAKRDISDVIMYDKHGPLDLILYHDSHEEVRKWARNKIREMSHDDIKSNISNYLISIIKKPVDSSDMLDKENMGKLCDNLIEIISSLGEDDIVIAANENMTTKEALKSMVQLSVDLKEAIHRCYDNLNYVSTAYFIFAVAQQIKQMMSFTQMDVPRFIKLNTLSDKLFRNYLISTFAQWELDA